MIDKIFAVEMVTDETLRERVARLEELLANQRSAYDRELGLRRELMEVERQQRERIVELELALRSASATIHYEPFPFCHRGEDDLDSDVPMNVTCHRCLHLILDSPEHRELAISDACDGCDAVESCDKPVCPTCGEPGHPACAHLPLSMDESLTDDLPDFGQPDMTDDEFHGHLRECSECVNIIAERLGITVPQPTVPLDDQRCAFCGWPLKATVEEGCVRGNCAQRPLPEYPYDPERAERETGTAPGFFARCGR